MVRRKRGAQPNNHNARKHGYYASALVEAEQLELGEAEEIEGLDSEIALLRVKLRTLIEEHPKQLELQLKAVSTLGRLVSIRYNISNEHKKSLRQAVTTVLRDVAVPLGIKFLP